MRAAYDYLAAKYDSPGEAAKIWNVARQNVNYYVRKLTNEGRQRSVTTTENSIPKKSATATVDTEKDDDLYEQAWIYAGELCETLGRRAAAKAASEKFNVHVSASSARRSYLANGVFPASEGGSLLFQRLLKGNSKTCACCCVR